VSPFAGFLIGPAPPLADGPGQIVTGTFAHSAANVINLYVDGLHEPIGTTDNHPFWSEDRQAFVPAGDLKSGERLRTQDGQLLALTASRPRAADAVFNLEVNIEHVYYVGIQGLLVHNSYSSYRDLRKLTKGTGLQAHHLLEKRFANTLGVNPNSMQAIALTPAEHQVFTNAWRQAIPYGQGTANATRQQIMNAGRQIYRDYPDILRALGL